MSTPGNRNTAQTTGTATTAGASVVIIRPSTVTLPTNSFQSPASGRIMSPALPGNNPFIRVGTPTIGTNIVAGSGLVLRGNQLVRIPLQASTESSSTAGQKSPIKVHLVSASGLVKPHQVVASQASSGKPEAGTDKTKYQVLGPHNASQVVVVNSSMPSKPDRAPTEKSEEGSQGTALQSLASSGAPAAKRNRVSTGVAGGRKACNCTKSQCLKLYCECFANGEFCRNCNCTSCHNNLAYENERSKAIKMCLERNPYAFQPKIGMKSRAELERLHNKGCNCKKSNCLKNYCECYEAKVPCTPRCKCAGCRNTEGDRFHRYRGAGGLQSLVNAASLLSVTAQGERSTGADSPATDYDKPDPKKMPWYYLTDDVVEATSVCLLAKAEQLETKGTYNDVEMQGEILKEFGRCLQQIIDSASG